MIGDTVQHGGRAGGQCKSCYVGSGAAYTPSTRRQTLGAFTWRPLLLGLEFGHKRLPLFAQLLPHVIVGLGDAGSHGLTLPHRRPLPVRGVYLVEDAPQIVAEEAGGKAMSAERKDKPDAPERPDAGRRLRLIKTPEAERPEPAPEMKAILDDRRRRYRVHRERAGREPEGKDVA